MQHNPTTRILHIVYVLIDPRTDEVRYVGVTQQSLNQRIWGHISDARKSKLRYVSRWILGLLQRNLRPIARIIEETTDRDREKYWIAYYRQAGARLTNLADGGGGIPGIKHSDNTRQRMRTAALTRWSDPDFKESQRIRLIGHSVSKETRQKIGKANQGRKFPGKKMPPFSEEHRKKLSIARKEGRTGCATWESHGTHTKPDSYPKGAERWCAKLTDDDVRYIRSQYASKQASQGALAREFGVHPSTIYSIVHRKKWKHIE